MNLKDIVNGRSLTLISDNANTPLGTKGTKTKNPQTVASTRIYVFSEHNAGTQPNASQVKEYFPEGSRKEEKRWTASKKVLDTAPAKSN